MNNPDLKILFASQREYFRDKNCIKTVGPIGAETGQNYINLFPSMVLIGRLSKKNTSSTVVSHADAHLIEFNLRSPKIIFNYFFAVYKIIKIIKEVDGVIVRAGGLGTLVAFVSIILKKPTGIEVGGCVFNSLWNYGGLAGKLAAYPSYYFRRYILKQADRVQMVTQNYLQDRYFYKNKHYKSIGISNVQVNQKNIKVLNERLNRDLSNGNVILGSIGSFNGTFKGHDKAIECCALLNKKGMNVKLYLLGAGSRESLVEKAKVMEISEQIRFYDPLPPGKEVENWLNLIDIYCQFSRREGISRALIEAMNLGTPVVATDVGGTFELANKKTLFQADNLQHVCEIIEKYITNKIFYKEMCRYSYNKAGEYSEEKLTSKRIDFWKDFANHDIASGDNSGK